MKVISLMLIYQVEISWFLRGKFYVNATKQTLLIVYLCTKLKTT